MWFTGRPAYPVRRFSSSPATTRGSTWLPRRAAVTTTPKLATRLRDADPEHALGTAQRRRDADAARASPGSGSARRTRPGRASCSDTRPAPRSVPALVPRECARGHAAPERDAPGVRAASELDVRVDVAGRRRPRDGRRDGQLSRHCRPSPAASSRTPAVVSRTTRTTCHAPAPPPASSSPTVLVVSSPRVEKPERHRGGGREEQRPVGALERDDAASLPSSARPRVPARRRSPCPDCTSADLICGDRPARMPLVQQRRRAGDMRRRHARPREGRPASARDRREDVYSWCRNVGLEAQARSWSARPTRSRRASASSDCRRSRPRRR